jgi:hypothetical protein
MSNVLDTFGIAEDVSVPIDGFADYFGLDEAVIEDADGFHMGFSETSGARIMVDMYIDQENDAMAELFTEGLMCDESIKYNDPIIGNSIDVEDYEGNTRIHNDELLGGGETEIPSTLGASEEYYY